MTALGNMENTDNKIQIITNSEIRYRGRLYQVNPMDKTIALRDVISFGTEDRRTDRVIPPVQTVYDCIVFRSVDIKELEVVANEGDNDPKSSEQTGSKDAPLGNNAEQHALDNNEIENVVREKSPEIITGNVKKDEARIGTGSGNDQNPKFENNTHKSPAKPNDYYRQHKGSDERNNRNSRNFNDQRSPVKGYGDKNNRNHGSGKKSYDQDQDQYEKKDESKPEGPQLQTAYAVLKGAREEFDFSEMDEKMYIFEEERQKEMKEMKEKLEKTKKYQADDFFDCMSTS